MGEPTNVATSKRDNTLVMVSNKFLLFLTLPSVSHEKVINGGQGSYILRKSTITRKEEINMQNVTYSKTNVLTALNGKEIKSETSCDLNAFDRNTQSGRAIKKIAMMKLDNHRPNAVLLTLRETNELFMPVEGQMNWEEYSEAKKRNKYRYGYQKLKN